MKRSEINILIDQAKNLVHDQGMRLPPFAYSTPEEWKTQGVECDEIRQCRPGWG